LPVQENKTRRAPEPDAVSYDGVVNESSSALTTVEEQEALPEKQEEGLRFNDPYWDDAFCAWWDPALRTCCS
jgi:hypothetical protein